MPRACDAPRSGLGRACRSPSGTLDARLWLCASVLTLALLAAPAGQLVVTAQAQPPNADEARRKLESKQNELKSAKDRESALARDVAEIDAEREQLKKRLLETAGLIQKSEAKMTSIEGRLGELEAQEKIVRGSLDQRHGQISKLLGALQRMGRNPPPVMITQRADALRMVRSAMLLAAAFPELRGQAAQLSGRLQELVRVMDDIRSESTRLKGETEKLNDARTKLAGLMEERKQSLDQRRSELADVRRAATDITRNVSDLNELITKLDKAVTENTALGTYQRELASRPAAPAEAPAAAAPRGPGPIVVTPDPQPGVTADVETKVALNVPKPGEIIELRPNGFGSGSAGRIRPAIPFQEAKGRLPRPAAGKAVLNFGEKTQYGGQSKGIVIETRTGAQITSPCDGWIVFAGEFRAYGQLLIINAGGGYHVLLAGLSRIDVELGQFVLAAEPVGSMGGAARELKSDAAAPVLYVEFRKEDRPVDPSPWWATGPEKVQG